MPTYESFLVKGEKISETEYKLLTEENWSYKYILMDRTSENFLKEEESWKLHVLQGENRLLEWIMNPSGENPPLIYWNFEGRAMLEVPLDQDSGYGTFATEINPFDIDIEDWVIDPNCPLPK